MNREEKLNRLREQFNKLNENGDYEGSIDKPHAGLIECNFGGKFIILSRTGESAIVWTDWSGEAIDENLTEVEIEYRIIDKNDEDYESNEDDYTAGFYLKEEWYSLNHFERFDRIYSAV